MAVLGALLLVVSDFQTLYAVKVLTVTKATVVGHDQHSFGMLLIGLAALAMAAGSALASNARPAMAAVAALGVVALLITLIGDLPDVNSTGLVGQLYAEASAGPRIGFYIETLGAVTLIFSGISMLLLSVPGGARGAARRGGRRGHGGDSGRGGRGGRRDQPAAASAAASAPVDAEDAGWF